MARETLLQTRPGCIVATAVVLIMAIVGVLIVVANSRTTVDTTTAKADANRGVMTFKERDTTQSVQSGSLVMKSYTGNGYWWLSVRPSAGGGDVSIPVPLEVWREARLGSRIGWFVRDGGPVLFSMWFTE